MTVSGQQPRQAYDDDETTWKQRIRMASDAAIAVAEHMGTYGARPMHVQTCSVQLADTVLRTVRTASCFASERAVSLRTWPHWITGVDLYNVAVYLAAQATAHHGRYDCVWLLSCDVVTTLVQDTPYWHFHFTCHVIPARRGTQ